MATVALRTRLATREGLQSVVQSGTVRVAALAIGIKLLLFLYGWLAYVLVPQETRVMPTDPHLGVDWLRIWSQWDVGAYLRIAERGYLPDDPGTSSFFPLLPILMRAFDNVTGNTFLAGLIISTTAMIGVAIVLYHLTLLKLRDEPTALRAAFYALIYPAAFYTSTVYSEALFLLCAVASFYLMERQRWVWAGVAGGLAAMTRIVGVMLIVPLALAYGLTALKRRGIDWGVLGLPAVLAGFWAVALIFWTQAGDPLAFVHGQQEWGRGISSPHVALQRGWQVLNWQHLVPGFEENYTTNALNWGAAVLFIALAIVSFRMLGPAYGTYALISVLVPLAFTPLGDRPAASMLRLTLLIFPGFMVLAQWGRHPIVDRLITVGFLLFLGLLTALFLRSWNVAGVS